LLFQSSRLGYIWDLLFAFFFCFLLSRLPLDTPQRPELRHLARDAGEMARIHYIRHIFISFRNFLVDSAFTCARDVDALLTRLFLGLFLSSNSRHHLVNNGQRLA
jgi:hypothetical protein